MVEILFSLFMTSAPAHAGDTLYLQSGQVNVDDALKDFDWERDRRHRKDLLRGDKKTHLFIVQFRSAITDRDRQDLNTLKARVLGYVPDDAYVVEATGVVAQTIRLSSTRVRDVLKFESQWKISPQLKDADESTKVEVSTCSGKTFEARVRSAADLERLADQEQTLWIAPAQSVTHDADESDDGNSDGPMGAGGHLPRHEKRGAGDVVGRILESQLIDGEEAKAEELSSQPKRQAASANEDDSSDSGLSVENEKGIALGETDTYPLAVRRRGHVRIELTYDDAEAARCADAEFVNEVSVTVKDSEGHEQTQSGPHSVLEFIVAKGSYDIHVHGENVPTAVGGRQPYTLHVSVD